MIETVTSAIPRQRVVAVMPAYNAARTLHKTYGAIPPGTVDRVILVDDASSDATVDIARSLNLEIFCHDRNYGYGANQKTCYREALKTECDVVVMLHPDYQYDPSLLPSVIQPILDGHADVVLGSRLLGNDPTKQGMPWWKHIGNRVLTRLENWMFGLHLSEYHTGYRAYSRRVLEDVNFGMNSDAFVFDQEIIAQIVAARFRIHEVPVPARYFAEASSASLRQSVVYGLAILRLLARYGLHVRGLRRCAQFESLTRRYRTVQRESGAPEEAGTGREES